MIAFLLTFLLSFTFNFSIGSTTLSAMTKNCVFVQHSLWLKWHIKWAWNVNILHHLRTYSHGPMRGVYLRNYSSTKHGSAIITKKNFFFEPVDCWRKYNHKICYGKCNFSTNDGLCEDGYIYVNQNAQKMFQLRIGRIYANEIFVFQK